MSNLFRLGWALGAGFGSVGIAGSILHHTLDRPAFLVGLGLTVFGALVAIAPWESKR